MGERGHAFKVPSEAKLGDATPDDARLEGGVSALLAAKGRPFMRAFTAVDGPIHV